MIYTIKIMYLINDCKILAFPLFIRCRYLSAFDHEHHLVSWLNIKFCDIGASHYNWHYYQLGLFSLYFRLQDIAHKLGISLSNSFVIAVAGEICL